MSAFRQLRYKRPLVVWVGPLAICSSVIFYTISDGIMKIKAPNHHAVNALGEGGRVVEGETGSEQRNLEQEKGQFMDRFVNFVLNNFPPELFDNVI